MHSACKYYLMRRAVWRIRNIFAIRNVVSATAASNSLSSCQRLRLPSWQISRIWYCQHFNSPYLFIYFYVFTFYLTTCNLCAQPQAARRATRLHKYACSVYLRSLSKVTHTHTLVHTVTPRHRQGQTSWLGFAYKTLTSAKVRLSRCNWNCCFKARNWRPNSVQLLALRTPCSDWESKREREEERVCEG